MSNSIVGTWVFKDTIDLTPLYDGSETYVYFYIDYEYGCVQSEYDSVGTYMKIYKSVDDNILRLIYNDTIGGTADIAYNDRWIGYQKTITINGGADVENETFVNWLNANAKKVTRKLTRLYPGPVVAKSATRQLRKLVTEEPQPSVGTIKAGTYMLKDTLTAVEGINYVQDTEIIDIETVECELNGNPLIFTGIVIPATYDNSNNVSLKAIDISEGENYPRDFVIYQNYWHSSLQNIKTFTITKDTETKYYDWFIANATKVESTFINFTANDVSLQAIEGQTWREWVATANNTAGYSIKEILYQGTTSEYVVVGSTDNQYTVLDGKDDFVRPDDKIIDGRTYPTYTLTEDVIPDIWILNDTLTPYAGSANLTVSDIEGAFYSRTSLSDSTLIEHPVGSITLCVNPKYSSDTILKMVSSGTAPYAKTEYLNNSSWHCSYYNETGSSSGGYVNDAADLVSIRTLSITKYPDNQEFMDWLDANATKQ